LFGGSLIHFKIARQEFMMSSINGDKSRFNRERKQKISRRKRNRELFDSAKTKSASPKPPAAAKPQTVSA